MAMRCLYFDKGEIMRELNDSALKNYLYFELFLKKYEIYLDERPYKEMEQALQILQHLFERDITINEHLLFLKLAVKFGSLSLKRAMEYTTRKPNKIKEIAALTKEAKEKVADRSFLKASRVYEELLRSLSDALDEVENVKSIKPSDKPARIDTTKFASEYDALMQCKRVHDNIYTRIQKAENIAYLHKDSSALIHQSAIDSVFDALTHLSRHVTMHLSEPKEIERAREYMRMAALEFLRLGVRSTLLFFKKTEKTDQYKRLSVEFAALQTLEVEKIPPAVFADLKLKYTLLLGAYKNFII